MGKVVARGLVALLFAPGQPPARSRCAAQPSGAGREPVPHLAGIDSSVSTASTGTLPETARVVVPAPGRDVGQDERLRDAGPPDHRRVQAAHRRRLRRRQPGRTSSPPPTVAWRFAGPATGYGHLILIEHTVGGKRVATGYAHMYADGIHVKAGDTVTAGQYIADVGSDGYSTGSHLHFEVRPGGADAAPVDPEPWLASNGAAERRGRLSHE